MSRVLAGAWLVAVWVALWGDLSAANVLSGTALATLLLLVFPTKADPGRGLRFRPLPVVRLAAYFVGQSVKSNWALVRAVLSRRDALSTGVIEVPLTCASPGLMTIVHHLIQLTPGTTVIEVHREPPVFYVHLVQLADVEAARAECHRLDQLVLEAFGPAEAVDRVRAAAAEAEAEAEGEALR